MRLPTPTWARTFASRLVPRRMALLGLIGGPWPSRGKAARHGAFPLRSNATPLTTGDADELAAGQIMKTGGNWADLARHAAVGVGIRVELSKRALHGRVVLVVAPARSDFDQWVVRIADVPSERASSRCPPTVLFLVRAALNPPGEPTVAYAWLAPLRTP
jgi:hypothetical protein